MRVDEGVDDERRGCGRATGAFMAGKKRTDDDDDLVPDVRESTATKGNSDTHGMRVMAGVRVD